jgi:hypothetical protein
MRMPAIASFGGDVLGAGKFGNGLSLGNVLGEVGFMTKRSLAMYC